VTTSPTRYWVGQGHLAYHQTVTAFLKMVLATAKAVGSIPAGATHTKMYLLALAKMAYLINCLNE
jgi:hypothetical protein